MERKYVRPRDLSDSIGEFLHVIESIGKRPDLLRERIDLDRRLGYYPKRTLRTKEHLGWVVAGALPEPVAPVLYDLSIR